MNRKNLSTSILGHISTIYSMLWVDSDNRGKNPEKLNSLHNNRMHILSNNGIVGLHPQITSSQTRSLAELHVEKRIQITASTNTMQL